jgi:hypothetical protein
LTKFHAFFPNKNWSIVSSKPILNARNHREYADRRRAGMQLGRGRKYKTETQIMEQEVLVE